MKLLIAHTVILRVDNPNYIDTPNNRQLLKEQVNSEVQDMFMDYTKNPEDDLEIATLITPIVSD